MLHISIPFLIVTIMYEYKKQSIMRVSLISLSSRDFCNSSLYCNGYNCTPTNTCTAFAARGVKDAATKRRSHADRERARNRLACRRSGPKPAEPIGSSRHFTTMTRRHRRRCYHPAVALETRHVSRLEQWQQHR